ncbi:HNH endonuclease signature motif containing protein [Kitasatospora sp. NPDC002551]|uniref:HNH endonuclease n=1 Tax=Kitasatospora sp. NPDC002551 TaxID=3154539 RepID=UPI003325CD0D
MGAPYDDPIADGPDGANSLVLAGRTLHARAAQRAGGGRLLGGGQGLLGVVRSLTGLPEAAVIPHLLGAAMVWVGALRVLLAARPARRPAPAGAGPVLPASAVRTPEHSAHLRRRRRPPLAPVAGSSTVGRSGERKDVAGVGDYAKWYDEILKAESRAKGGEPCRVCGEAIAPNAQWKQRDRHVCSPRCNATLKRRLNRRIERGEVVPPPPPTPEPEPPREPLVFRTLAQDAPFPYEFLGRSPRPGDIVERHGSRTVYLPLAVLPPETVPWEVTVGAPEHWDLDRVVFAVHEETGSTCFYEVDESGTRTSLLLGQFLGPHQLDTYEPFEAGGRTWCWYQEVVRDVDQDGEPYTWTAHVCGLQEIPTLWTPAYAARSERLKRVSRAAGNYAARMRALGQEGEIERLDPREIYERDGWFCRICGAAVDPDLSWPDLWCATLDHRVPVTAGGGHTADNVQLSHWLCNLRKGDLLLTE